ncbi:ATP-dependent RNA helicase DBP3 [Amaranthus tricolor]|uniref:ATP-dependent RNA helicase DBP3 n=1 Tax=Amaranthus tricolor TaxID=29722 RepID=UPI0025826101|nr:ATP-dependent RNA helicase DBP3 [Amaranthus tricolor]
MEKERKRDKEKDERDKREKEEQQQKEERNPYTHEKHQAPNISEMKPATENAYGGGMYAQDEEVDARPSHPPASLTQSADGPPEAHLRPKRQPPSSGDRDIDITGQSYIQ